MKVERTPGAQKAYDEMLTNLYLYDMTDDELRQLAKALHIPLDHLQIRAAEARRKIDSEPKTTEWQVP
jgi:hypothetical protein